MILGIVMNATIIKIVTKAVEAALPAIIDSVQNKLGKKQNPRSPNTTGTLDQQLSKIQTTLEQNTKQIKSLEEQIKHLTSLLDGTKPKPKTPAAKKTATTKPTVKQAVVKRSAATKVARKK